MKNIKYWRKGKELHIQKGMTWGNDLTCVVEGEMGTYKPWTDQEHIERGYKEITFEEAQELAEIAGYDVGEDEE